ncbi:Retrovirus-related Pol polyprotein from transposon TNT 1-94 [Sesbania bispinosa]|nr:Retrovirus-related Pol polyprotein from transposon TNT 1-94 [Sesbania bispinosa]
MEILKGSNQNDPTHAIAQPQQYPGNILTTQKVIKLLNDIWILDSGATDPVSNSLACYASNNVIDPI